MAEGPQQPELFRTLFPLEQSQSCISWPDWEVDGRGQDKPSIESGMHAAVYEAEDGSSAEGINDEHDETDPEDPISPGEGEKSSRFRWRVVGHDGLKAINHGLR